MSKKLIDIVIDKIAGVDKAANRKKFLIVKRDDNEDYQENIMKKDIKYEDANWRLDSGVVVKVSTLPGMSEKDFAWTQILDAANTYSNDYNQKQFENMNAAGGSHTQAGSAAYKALSREQLLSEFLQTPAGKSLYAKYMAANDAVNPAYKPPTVTGEGFTLKKYSDEKLHAIAKRYHALHPEITVEAAELWCSKNDKDYRNIYAATWSAGDLAKMDKSGRISKSDSDALRRWEQEIKSLVRKAGV